jgi:hypothetical protein
MAEPTVSFRKDALLHSQTRARLMRVVKDYDYKSAEAWQHYLANQREWLCGLAESRSKLSSEWKKLADMYKTALKTLNRSSAADDSWLAAVKAGYEDALRYVAGRGGGGHGWMGGGMRRTKWINGLYGRFFPVP